MPKSDDDKIWAAYAKGVKPLKQDLRAKNSVIPAKAGLHRIMPLAPVESSSGSRIAPLAKVRGLSGVTRLDRKTERRLRQGAVTVEAKLDLHGMNQREAHKALNEFLAAQIKAGRRALLVVTGKGRLGEGVLRARLADWIAASTSAPTILTLRPAAARHGGTGAFYVLLKRRKEKDVP